MQSTVRFQPSEACARAALQCLVCVVFLYSFQKQLRLIIKMTLRSVMEILPINLLTPVLDVLSCLRTA